MQPSLFIEEYAQLSQHLNYDESTAGSITLTRINAPLLFHRKRVCWMCSLQNTIPIPVIVLDRDSIIVGVAPVLIRVRGKAIHITVRLTISSRNAPQSKTARGNHLLFSKCDPHFTLCTQTTPYPQLQPAYQLTSKIGPIFVNLPIPVAQILWILTPFYYHFVFPWGQDASALYLVCC